jgi:hypothetical protein
MSSDAVFAPPVVGEKRNVTVHVAAIAKVEPQSVD